MNMKRLGVLVLVALTLAGCGGGYGDVMLRAAAIQAGGNVLGHVLLNRAWGSGYAQPAYVVQPQVRMCETTVNGLYVGIHPCVAGNVIWPSRGNFAYPNGYRGPADYQQYGPYGSTQMSYAHIWGQGP